MDDDDDDDDITMSASCQFPCPGLVLFGVSSVILIIRSTCSIYPRSADEQFCNLLTHRKLHGVYSSFLRVRLIIIIISEYRVNFNQRISMLDFIEKEYKSGQFQTN